MLEDLQWLKFEEMVMYQKIMLFNKVIMTNAAPFCRLLLIRGMMQRQVHYNVRVRELRIAWRPRTAKRGQKSYLVTAVKLYNDVKVEGKGYDKDDLKEAVKSEIIRWRK